MSGQMKSYSEKKEMVEHFIEKCNPYQPLNPLKFDLRGYAKYIEENEISYSQVTPEILEKFKVC